MRLLHNIGSTDVKHAQSNYNTREEIEACSDELSFDGVYRNVYDNRDVLKGRGCLLFVVGNVIGGNNSFDTGMPREDYCFWSEIKELEEEGHTIGWHTWNHKNLTKVSLEVAREEMTPPYPMTDFAYPHGEFNEDLMRIAQELGYERAWSVTQGNDNPYSLRRDYL